MTAVPAMEGADRVLDAAAQACGRPAASGAVVRQGRSTLVRFSDVLARVRRHEDRSVAERELAVALALDTAGVPAVRPVQADRCPIEVGEFVVTLWTWIDRSDRTAGPGETGRLAALLHRATSAEEVRRRVPRFDPLGATKCLLVDDASADAAFLTTLVDELAVIWADAAAADPLGEAVVHGDLHAENVVIAASHPVLIDLELAGVGPPSYDAAPMGVAVQRYGADPTSLDAFVASWPADPRRWAGFGTCCRVYEAWVAAWAVSQRAESLESEDEAAIRVAALRGETARAWRLR